MSRDNGKANAAPRATGLLELPLLELPERHPCHECGACCRYVAVEIDKPTCFKDYDHIHWYLTHRGISVYVDWEGDWFIEFETACEHLSPGATCGIYEDRPQICSDFSWDECEKTTRERAWKYRFVTQEEFLAWHREKRPKSYDRYVAARRKLAEKRRSLRREAQSSTSSSSALRISAERSRAC
ncbi:MAG: YkgJ family cysteine cluster protein [Myxococcota bacterium]